MFCRLGQWIITEYLVLYPSLLWSTRADRQTYIAINRLNRTSGPIQCNRFARKFLMGTGDWGLGSGEQYVDPDSE